MIELIDNIVIFIIELLFYLNSNQLAANIGWVLFIISVICILNLCKGKKINLIIAFMLMMITIFYNNNLIFFLPSVQYHILEKDKINKSVILTLISIILILSIPLEKNIIYYSYMFISMLISSYMYYKTQKIYELKNKKIELEDNSKNDILNLKNKYENLKEKEKDNIEIVKLKERNQIARDIHDSVGHILSRAIIQIGAIKTLNKDNNLTKMLNELNDSLISAMDNIRQSVHRIYLETTSIENEINEIISEFPKYKINFEHSDNISKFNAKTKSTILYIIKEALNNTVKHSNADTIDIEIKEYNAFIKFVISDNGTNEISANFENGIGLKNIKNRINELNGSVNFFTDNGFKIYINIPK